MCFGLLPFIIAIIFILSANIILVYSRKDKKYLFINMNSSFLQILSIGTTFYILYNKLYIFILVISLLFIEALCFIIWDSSIISLISSNCRLNTNIKTTSHNLKEESLAFISENTFLLTGRFLILIFIFLLSLWVIPPIQIVVDPPEIAENISAGESIVDIISISNLGAELGNITTTPNQHDSVPLCSPLLLNCSTINDTSGTRAIKFNTSVNNIWVRIINPGNVTILVGDPVNDSENSSLEFDSQDILWLGSPASTVWLNSGSVSKTNLAKDEIGLFQVTLDAKNLTRGEYRGFIDIKANISVISGRSEQKTIGRIPVVLNVAE